MMRIFKRIISLLAVAAIVLSLAACGENTELFKKGEALQAEPIGTYIAKEVAAKFEMKTVATYNEKEYKAFEYRGNQVLTRVEKSGNHLLLFEYPLDTVIEYDLEATKRSGKYIYFTKKDSGAQYASLCAVYMPSNTQKVVVDTPCSNMVILDSAPNNEMYTYGIIVNTARINVIDLKSSGVSSYSKTLADFKKYIDAGEKLFSLGNFGAYTETTLEAVDRKHVMVNIIEKNSKGEVKNEINFTFNPANGVASF